MSDVASISPAKFSVLYSAEWCMSEAQSTQPRLSIGSAVLEPILEVPTAMAQHETPQDTQDSKIAPDQIAIKTDCGVSG